MRSSVVFDPFGMGDLIVAKSRVEGPAASENGAHVLVR